MFKGKLLKCTLLCLSVVLVVGVVAGCSKTGKPQKVELQGFSCYIPAPTSVEKSRSWVSSDVNEGATDDTTQYMKRYENDKEAFEVTVFPASESNDLSEVASNLYNEYKDNKYTDGVLTDKKVTIDGLDAIQYGFVETKDGETNYVDIIHVYDGTALYVIKYSSKGSEENKKGLKKITDTIVIEPLTVDEEDITM